MSHAPQDFDFWEFMNCGRCQLPFASGHTTVPFWLTECGHVICNNHLNADQSCSKCGASGIQLVPLQREMDAPMSDWFRSVPVALDTIANAAKFQQETLAAQIIHHRSRHQQQRILIERLKRDISELKKTIEILTNENGGFRQHLNNGQHTINHGYDGNQAPSNVPNPNGKRQMVPTQTHEGQHRRFKSGSSPLSAMNPLGPSRLTLPQGHHTPKLSSKRADLGNGSTDSMNHPRETLRPDPQRPTSGFIEQYAYVPPLPQLHPQGLSHTQMAPRLFQRAKPSQDQDARDGYIRSHAQQFMRPPPTPARFKPAQRVASSSAGLNQSGQKDTTTQSDGPLVQYKSMNPPPTPIGPHGQNIQAMQSHNSTLNSGQMSNNPRPLPDYPAPHPQRFTPLVPQSQHPPPPPTNSRSGPQRFIPSGSRAPSRAAPLPEDNQRTRFVQGGFT